MAILKEHTITNTTITITAYYKITGFTYDNGMYNPPQAQSPSIKIFFSGAESREKAAENKFLPNGGAMWRYTVNDQDTINNLLANGLTINGLYMIVLNDLQYSECIPSLTTAQLAGLQWQEGDRTYNETLQVYQTYTNGNWVND